jgi:hypothetical protein
MFRLYDNNEKEYGLFTSYDAAWKAMISYLDEIQFKYYYFRQSLLEDGTSWVDYGSHSHFFYIENTTEAQK